MRRNVPTKIGIISILLIIVASVTACGGSPSNSTAPPESGEATAGDAATPADDGTVYEFNFTHQDPATTKMAPVFDQWCKDLEANSNGRIKVTMYYGGTLAGPTEALNMVEQGSVDLCWNAISHNPGRFEISEIMSLPYVGIDNPMLATVVYNELYNEVPEIKSEWNMVHVLAMNQNANNPISTRDVKLDDPKKFEGLRIRSTLQPAITLFTELGASPMSFSITDSYENISKNVADGLLNDWHNLEAQNLWEVCKYTLDVNAGPGFGFVAMNPDSYNSMPEDLRQIFDDTSKGLDMKLAEVMANCRQSYAEVAAANGVEIYKPNEAVDTAMSAAAEKSKQAWIDTVAAKGFDGEALLATLTEKCDKYRAQYEKYNFD
jgi:TRAP-type C4-dicarboxylate transport system substrate-binding protein